MFAHSSLIDSRYVVRLEATNAMTTEKWEIDYAHSSIEFAVRHMVVAKVKGHFERWTGELELDTGSLANSKVAVTIEAGSIQTREAQRDAHLKSPDFLNAEGFPTLTFTSSKVETSDKEHLKITGALTIRGVTKEVVLEGVYAGRAKDPWGSEKAGFSAKTKIDRKAFGLEWNQVLEAGGVLVGETVEIAIELEAKKTA